MRRGSLATMSEATPAAVPMPGSTIDVTQDYHVLLQRTCGDRGFQLVAEQEFLRSFSSEEFNVVHKYHVQRESAKLSLKQVGRDISH